MVIGYHNPELDIERNENDCWNVALMYALEKPYEEVRTSVSQFIEKNGSLRGGFIAGILSHNGFIGVEFDDATVKEIIPYIDSCHNHIVIVTKKHTFYVNNRIIFDSMELKKLLKKKVNTVYYKEKEAN